MAYGINHGSQELEAFARRIGFWSFNRWAKNQGMPMEQALAVVRAVF